jgi:Uncharacterised conserved protein (DUF2362)
MISPLIAGGHGTGMGKAVIKVRRTANMQEFFFFFSNADRPLIIPPFKALFSRCHQSTEFHFPDIDSQLQTIENDYVDNQKTVDEGDFFITRHSNLPLTQIVFHLVIDGDGKLEAGELRKSMFW